jgi:broad specificity phosphatase PhoE
VSATTVHVVRHGRTTLNAEGRYRGRLDPHLDDVGRAQADEAAASLAGAPLVAVLASPLVRASETARPIAAGHDLAVEPFAAVTDLDHGRWTGLTPAEAEALDPEAFARLRSDPFSCKPPGGEPVAELTARMREAIRTVADRFPGGDVVVVTHEIPIRVLLASILALEGSRLWELDVPTGSIAGLLVDEDAVSVLRMPAAPGLSR